MPASWFWSTLVWDAGLKYAYGAYVLENEACSKKVFWSISQVQPRSRLHLCLVNQLPIPLLTKTDKPKSQKSIFLDFLKN